MEKVWQESVVEITRTQHDNSKKLIGSIEWHHLEKLV